MVAIQTATGEVLWRKSLRQDFGGVPGNWAYAESPLIDGDTLVVSPGGAEAAYASASVIEAAGRKQYVQFLDKGVVGVDASSGEFLWRYDGTASGPSNIPTPVAHGDFVYSSNARRFGGGLVKLSASGDGVAAEEVYFARSVPNTLGGQIFLDGYLYGTNKDGLVAAEFESGQVR